MLESDILLGQINRMWHTFTVIFFGKQGGLLEEKVVILTKDFEVPGSEFTSSPDNYTVYQNKAANVKSNHLCH